MSFATAELHDAYTNKFNVAEPIFREFGNKAQFHGEILVVKVDHDFILIKQTLAQSGLGRVLVVDGGGAKDCAMLGDKLAAKAVEKKWAGIIINGCIRDAEEIDQLHIGVKALGTCPIRPGMEGGGTTGGDAQFAGVTFVTGHYAYADRDGILVSAESLTL